MTRTIALMYHALGEAEGPGVDPHYAVGLARFGEHLALWASLRQDVISARSWLAGSPGVILTFDDGHESNYRLAFPVLAGAHADADFFVNPRQVGTHGFATWSQLREMAEAGMSIQSHGLDHGYYLTELSPVRLREDLRQSRLEIEQHVGYPVVLLAPPGGRSPRKLVEIAREVGYTAVLNSKPGVIHRGARHTLCRLAVTSNTRSETLASWLHGGRALWLSRIRYSGLELAKRGLGDTRYEAVRRRLLSRVARSCGGDIQAS
jgi:peptidoglycan/xylan/chitin deacetylase (PgdA/CDA1 family)